LYFAVNVYIEVDLLNAVVDPARFFQGGAGRAAKHTEPSTDQQLTVIKLP
jgi:hypothetical protein